MPDHFKGGTAIRVRRLAAWTATALIVLSGAVVACGDNSSGQCGDGQTVCDDMGQPLIYAPYIVPVYGIYGQPGYRPAVTIYPGAPNYHTTYINHPPNYSPPVAPKPPPANPSNAKPTTPVKAPAPPGYTAPKVTVKAPSVSVKAPSVKVNAPAPKAPSVKVGK